MYVKEHVRKEALAAILALVKQLNDKPLTKEFTTNENILKHIEDIRYEATITVASRA